MKTALTVRNSRLRALALVLLPAAAVSISCGKVSRTGRAPVILVIDSLLGSSGAQPGNLSTSLESDVVTVVQTNIGGQQVLVPTVFEDAGEVQMHIVLKDPGTPGFPAVPSPLQDVVVNRYRVVYKRSDGRNTPGIDVPYPFDGAITFSVGSNGSTAGFLLVRIQAKLEAPLSALVGGGGAGAISTYAEVTFYGADLAGNAISATGLINVNFADWADPQ